ncbi:5'-AMP-activated protein kinase subunit beta-1 isoform X1 [Latimeria chalumnae]|uniref:5'-AMP-activated protein kinase subunit beta-1 isoform X1 n=1 Tax=Latimeria chalumnae TaxID=7897 RepID=UPI00313CB726
MGNTTSERAGIERQGGHKTPRRDSTGSGIHTKESDRPKILMDSPEDADIFHAEEIKAPLEKEEFLAWQQDLEVNDKAPAQARPTVFRWTGGGKEVYLSGTFTNWNTKIPLIRSHNNFVAILDLPEGEHQYKFFVDGQWTHDPSEPVVTSQLGTVNNIIQVKKTDFEVFDALMVDSQKCSDMSDLSSSPPGPYHQDPYVYKQEERFKAPPILPPHLLQVILNKDTGISEFLTVAIPFAGWGDGSQRHPSLQEEVRHHTALQTNLIGCGFHFIRHNRFPPPPHIKILQPH